MKMWVAADGDVDAGLQLGMEATYSALYHSGIPAILKYTALYHSGIPAILKYTALYHSGIPALLKYTALYHSGIPAILKSGVRPVISLCRNPVTTAFSLAIKLRGSLTDACGATPVRHRSTSSSRSSSYGALIIAQPSQASSDPPTRSERLSPELTSNMMLPIKRTFKATSGAIGITGVTAASMEVAPSANKMKVKVGRAVQRYVPQWMHECLFFENMMNKAKSINPATRMGGAAPAAPLAVEPAVPMVVPPAAAATVSEEEDHCTSGPVSPRVYGPDTFFDAMMKAAKAESVEQLRDQRRSSTEELLLLNRQLFCGSGTGQSPYPAPYMDTVPPAAPMALAPVAAPVVVAPAALVVGAPAAATVGAPAVTMVVALAAATAAPNRRGHTRHSSTLPVSFSAPASYNGGCTSRYNGGCTSRYNGGCTRYTVAPTVDAPAGTMVDAPAGTMVDAPAGTTVDAPAGTMVDAPAGTMVDASAAVTAAPQPPYAPHRRGHTRHSSKLPVPFSAPVNWSNNDSNERSKRTITSGRSSSGGGSGSSVALSALESSQGTKSSKGSKGSWGSEMSSSKSSCACALCMKGGSRGSTCSKTLCQNSRTSSTGGASTSSCVSRGDKGSSNSLKETGPVAEGPIILLSVADKWHKIRGDVMTGVRLFFGGSLVV
eukprot:gene10123-8023_t